MVNFSNPRTEVRGNSAGAIDIHFEVVSEVYFLINHRETRGLAEKAEIWNSAIEFSASSAKPLFSLWLKTLNTTS